MTAFHCLDLVTGLWLVLACPAWHVGPQERVPLADAASMCGFYQPESGGTDTTFVNRGVAMEFEYDSRKLLFGGTLVWMNAPLTTSGGELMVTQADLSGTILPLMDPGHILGDTEMCSVLLDPGHGGEDGGAVGRKVVEKTFVLDVAKRVRRALARRNIAACLTRRRDCALSLQERTALASERHAGILVSIHANASPNDAASGVETYVLPAPGFPSTGSETPAGKQCSGNNHDQAGVILAHRVHCALLARTRAPDRGVRRARFELLRNAPCPAILVECGFVSNPEEETKLADWKYRDAVARGIADGIAGFVRETQVWAEFRGQDEPAGTEAP